MPLSQRLLARWRTRMGRGGLCGRKPWLREMPHRGNHCPPWRAAPMLETISNQLTALGYGCVELEFKQAAGGGLVLMDFEDGNR